MDEKQSRMLAEVETFETEKFVEEVNKWLDEMSKIDAEDLYAFEPMDRPAFGREVINGMASLSVSIRVFNIEAPGEWDDDENDPDGNRTPVATWGLMPEYDGNCDYVACYYREMGERLTAEDVEDALNEIREDVKDEV